MRWPADVKSEYDSEEFGLIPFAGVGKSCDKRNVRRQRVDKPASMTENKGTRDTLLAHALWPVMHPMKHLATFVCSFRFWRGSRSFRLPLLSGPVDFNRDIQPILSNKCYPCHGPDDGKREAGLRLDDAKIATGKLESGAVAIVPHKPDASELIRRVTSSDEDERMPPAKFGKPLSNDEITALRKWVEQGAGFAKHWSYVRPVRSEPPAAPVAWRNWPRNAIDRFALQAMFARGLHPSPEEDRYGLIRRVFLDLTGLHSHG